MAVFDNRSHHFAFLSGGSALGHLIAAFDWSKTSIGHIEDWPQSLKTAVSIVLRSDLPMVVLWGPSGVMIYNDAYAVIAAARHPALLGSNVREGWPEASDFNDHVMQVCLGGGTLAFRDQELTLYRSGRAEQVWLNLDYSPILNEFGQPAGVFAIVNETNGRFIAELWQSTERDRQRQMFDQAPGFMAVLTGPNHIFELTNTAYMQLVGHRAVLGLPVRDALPEVEGQGFFEHLDHVYTTGERFVGSSLRAQIQRTPGADIEDRYIDLVYQPMRNPKGEVFGIFVQGADVTDRLTAETALRQSEALFRAFADSMPNHVWTSDANGLLDWFNPRVYAYSGILPGGLDGHGWASIVHPDDLKLAIDAWQSALAIGTFYETEFRLRRSDGAYRWHIARASPIRDTDGVIVRWIGTNTDIHDQKIITEKLAESERRLKLSQNAGGISSLELDIATGIVYGSDGFWQLWGLDPRESVHISVLEQIVIPDDKDIRSTPETRKNGTAATDVEYRIRRPDTGELRWLSRTIDFVHDAAGKPMKMFGVMQDITDRKDSEARQQMLTHELEHRIKNILAMVAAIASQTLRNTDLETGRKNFNDRLSALAKAHDILNDTRWTNASMGQVIRATMAVFPMQQISISGPPVALSPKMALSLALAVNELGTNALKYGALSQPDGTVSIDWTASPDDPPDNRRLIWRWQESGGPEVQPPQRSGFGSFLVERVLASDFFGAVRIEFPLSGVTCILDAPLPNA